MVTLCTIALDEPTVHHAEITGRSPLSIRTSETPWAYAVSFPVRPAASPAAEYVATLTLRVQQAPVGIGCLATGRDVLLDETIVEPSDTVRTVQLFLGGPSESSSVMVRNAAMSAPSAIQLFAAECRPLTTAEASNPSMLLAPVPRWSRYYSNVGQDVGEKRRLRRYLELTAPIDMPWIDGLSFVIHPGDELSRALYTSGTYEPNTLLVAKRLLRDGSVFVDVGAHAGVFTLAGARWVGNTGRVISFEPSERTLARLLDNVRRNGLSNVTVVGCAVARASGEVTLLVAGGAHSGLNTIGRNFAYPAVGVERTVKVASVTLDQFVRDASLDRIDLIKLDIEGAEYGALLGAHGVLRELRPALIIEVTASALAAHDADPGMLWQLLEQARYCCYRIEESTAALIPLSNLEGFDGDNIVALPVERAARS